MTFEEFQEIASEMFGESWRARSAKHLGIHRATISRWESSGASSPVPGPVEAAMRAWTAAGGPPEPVQPVDLRLRAAKRRRAAG